MYFFCFLSYFFINFSESFVIIAFKFLLSFVRCFQQQIFELLFIFPLDFHVETKFDKNSSTASEIQVSGKSFLIWLPHSKRKVSGYHYSATSIRTYRIVAVAHVRNWDSAISQKWPIVFTASAIFPAVAITG